MFNPYWVTLLLVMLQSFVAASSKHSERTERLSSSSQEKPSRKHNVLIHIEDGPPIQSIFNKHHGVAVADKPVKVEDDVTSGGINGGQVQGQPDDEPLKLNHNFFIQTEPDNAPMKPLTQHAQSKPLYTMHNPRPHPHLMAKDVRAYNPSFLSRADDRAPVKPIQIEEDVKPDESARLRLPTTQHSEGHMTLVKPIQIEEDVKPDESGRLRLPTTQHSEGHMTLVKPIQIEEDVKPDQGARLRLPATQNVNEHITPVKPIQIEEDVRPDQSARLQLPVTQNFKQHLTPVKPIQIEEDLKSKRGKIRLPTAQNVEEHMTPVKHIQIEEDMKPDESARLRLPATQNLEEHMTPVKPIQIEEDVKPDQGARLRLPATQNFEEHMTIVKPIQIEEDVKPDQSARLGLPATLKEDEHMKPVKPIQIEEDVKPDQSARLRLPATQNFEQHMTLVKPIQIEEDVKPDQSARLRLPATQNFKQHLTPVKPIQIEEDVKSKRGKIRLPRAQNVEEHMTPVKHIQIEEDVKPDESARLRLPATQNLEERMTPVKPIQIEEDVKPDESARLRLPATQNLEEHMTLVKPIQIEEDVKPDQGARLRLPATQKENEHMTPVKPIQIEEDVKPDQSARLRLPATQKENEHVTPVKPIQIEEDVKSKRGKIRLPRTQNVGEHMTPIKRIQIEEDVKPDESARLRLPAAQNEQDHMTPVKPIQIEEDVKPEESGRLRLPATQNLEEHMTPVKPIQIEEDVKPDQSARLRLSATQNVNEHMTPVKPIQIEEDVKPDESAWLRLPTTQNLNEHMVPKISIQIEEDVKSKPGKIGLPTIQNPEEHMTPVKPIQIEEDVKPDQSVRLRLPTTQNFEEHMAPLKPIQIEEDVKPYENARLRLPTTRIVGEHMIPNIPIQIEEDGTHKPFVSSQTIQTLRAAEQTPPYAFLTDIPVRARKEGRGEMNGGGKNMHQPPTSLSLMPIKSASGYLSQAKKKPKEDYFAIHSENGVSIRPVSDRTRHTGATSYHPQAPISVPLMQKSASGYLTQVKGKPKKDYFAIHSENGVSIRPFSGRTRHVGTASNVETNKQKMLAKQDQPGVASLIQPYVNRGGFGVPFVIGGKGINSVDSFQRRLKGQPVNGISANFPPNKAMKTPGSSKIMAIRPEASLGEFNAHMHPGTVTKGGADLSKGDVGRGNKPGMSVTLLGKPLNTEDSKTGTSPNLQQSLGAYGITPTQTENTQLKGTHQNAIGPVISGHPLQGVKNGTPVEMNRPNEKLVDPVVESQSSIQASNIPLYQAKPVSAKLTLKGNPKFSHQGTVQATLPNAQLALVDRPIPAHPVGHPKQHRILTVLGKPLSMPLNQVYPLEKIALQEHQRYRRMHLSRPLALSRDLVDEARRFAKKLSAQGKLSHDSVLNLRMKNQGENLGMVCSSSFIHPVRKVKRIVQKWYEEACHYNFNKPHISDETSHFTQLVWSASKELGIGVARGDWNGKHCVFVVARYRPMGNIPDLRQFQDNVKQKESHRPLRCVVKDEDVYI